jgi:cell fate regulator YaaT (PSP1 superfamily)
MKMAKLQRATLDPSKISGRCGRLKCCLRYEYDTYRELKRELPPIGAQIVTDKGRAKVLAQDILTGQVLIQTEDSRRVMIAADEVLTVLSSGGGRRSGDDRAGDAPNPSRPEDAGSPEPPEKETGQ